MNTIIDLLRNLWNLLACIGELLGYVLRFSSVFFQSRTCGIEEVRIAYRSPWQNPFVERFGGTLRRELLDHVIVLGEGHLERLLREFIEEYYHPCRPHQGLDGDTPIPQTKAQVPITGPTTLISTPILGGLHHLYQRVAA